MNLLYGPFSFSFFIAFGAFLAVFLILTAQMKNKDMDTRKRTLAMIMNFTVIFFVIYKIILYCDKPYSQINADAGIGGFSWWKELPLHLCNVNMLLIPFSLKHNSRRLLCFSYCLGPLGALMALMMPATGFNGYSLLLPRIFCFVATHWIVFFGCLAIGFWGICLPTMKDFVPTIITILVLNTIMFTFNMLLRLSTLEPHANYFYNVDPEGNPVLSLFMRWVPYPLLYTIPCLLIIIPVMCVMIGVSWLIRRKNDKGLIKEAE